MLVLSRKKNESIVINNDITIVIVEIRGDKVRLGIDAPKEIPVHRREVFDAIKAGERQQKEGEDNSSTLADQDYSTVSNALEEGRTIFCSQKEADLLIKSGFDGLNLMIIPSEILEIAEMLFQGFSEGSVTPENLEAIKAILEMEEEPEAEKPAREAEATEESSGAGSEEA